MIRRLAPALVLASLASCGGGEGSLKETILRDLATGVLLPARRDFVERAAELRRAAETGSVEGARKAWAEARRSWNLCQAGLVGPESDRLLDAKVDSFPVQAGRLEELAAGAGPLGPDDIERLGAGAKGLRAIEHLLYSQDVHAARRRELLAALARNLEAVAVEIRDLWEPSRGGFASRFEAMPRDAALDLLINRMVVLSEATADLLLARPLGKRPDDAFVPRPELVRSRPSGRSREEVGEILEGVMALYEGPPGGRGLSALVVRAAPDLDAPLRQSFGRALADVAAIPSPIDQAIAREPAAVLGAFASVKEFKMRLATDLVSVYRTTLRVSPFDGD